MPARPEGMPATTFQGLARAMFRHYRAGQYHEALAVAEEAASLFPEKRAQTAFWVACLKCRVGQTDEALHVLWAARRQGCWWGKHSLQDPDLDPLRERKEFQALVEECGRAQQEAQARAEPKALVHLPRGTPPPYPPPYPLLVALHAHGSTAEECARYFRPAVELGWAVAVPQGTQLEWENAFSWHDREKAEGEIATLFARVRQDNPVDGHNVILGGISAGGALAIRMALQGAPVSSAGFLALIPAVRDWAPWLPLLDQAARRGLRGWVLTGEEDHFLPEVRHLCAQMAKSGMACALEVVPGLGHELPEDLPQRLKRGLRFVAGD